MGVVFDEVIASVETPADPPPPETPAPPAEPPARRHHEIIDAVETRQRWVMRLRAE